MFNAIPKHEVILSLDNEKLFEELCLAAEVGINAAKLLGLSENIPKTDEQGNVVFLASEKFLISEYKRAISILTPIVLERIEDETGKRRGGGFQAFLARGEQRKQEEETPVVVKKSNRRKSSLEE